LIATPEVNTITYVMNAMDQVQPCLWPRLKMNLKMENSIYLYYSEVMVGPGLGHLAEITTNEDEDDLENDCPASIPKLCRCKWA
jgi:hypothetical protein